jgi:hypothetical protein
MECRECKYVTEHNGAFFCMAQKNMPYVTGDGVCESWKPTYITNADRIRSMTDKELAEFISNKARTFGEEYEGYMSALDWLQEATT